MKAHLLVQSAEVESGVPWPSRVGDAPKLSVIPWISIFETGDQELDAWHWKLINDCNKLLGLVTADADRAKIVTAIEDLVADCVQHFRVEEEILERHDFPRRDIHVAEHRRMEAELMALIWRLQDPASSPDQCRELTLWLAPALIDFMVRFDTDFRSHLLERRGR